MVILARDMDGYSERRAGLEQVRKKLSWPFEIVYAAAEPEIEAWHVAGFVPANEDELRRLKALRDELSFDPTTQSHRLTSHPNDAPTDAKRVLDTLCDSDAERKTACLGDREILHERGRMNGLSDFLDKIDQRIVPLFGVFQ